MINYKACTDVSMSQIFDAFSLGFSDYIIPLKMSQDTFESRFFGPEGNSLNLSFIALDGERPIGLILGGIRFFDGLKTMRCGTLCIGPEYRGIGVSHKLLEMHKSAAINEGCRQLFLEVIKGNDRAIKFYEDCGYRKTYKLKYYSGIAESIRFSECSAPYSIKHISFEKIDSFRNSLMDCHINWQSDTPFYAMSTNEAYLAAYEGNKEIAFSAMNQQGKINFLWVDPAYRNQGIGSSMVKKSSNVQNIEKVSICIPNNSSLEGFLRKLNFQKESIEQYEMYLPL
jgi:ribosomal protein S18 acetylase RimI-like enzyme